MPAPDMKGIKVRSCGFSLWKQKEAQEGRITIERVIEDTGLAKLTVRRFLAREGDVSGSTLGAAAIMATYLGTTLGELITVAQAEEVNAASGVRETAPA